MHPPEDEGLSIGTRKLVSLALVVTYIVSFLVTYINCGTLYRYLGLSYQPDFRLLAPLIAAFIVEMQFLVILVPALLIVSIQSRVTPLRIATVDSLCSPSDAACARGHRLRHRDCSAQ